MAKKFTIQSEDKTLLHAIEEKLKEYGFNDDQEWNVSRKNNDEYMNIVCYCQTDSDNKEHIRTYDYHRDRIVSDVYPKYKLPEQWNDVVVHMKNLQLKTTKYKVNDWVILQHKTTLLSRNFNGEIVQLKNKNRYDPDERGYIWGTNKCDDYGAPTKNGKGIFEDEIERHATKQEIYEHLNKNYSDIHVDDIVITKGTGTEFTIYTKALYSDFINGNFKSLACDNYFNKHGDHIALHGSDGFLYPIDLVEKVKAKFTFKTNIAEYKPEVDEKCITIGCIKNISHNELNSFEDILEFCERHKMKISIDIEGRISFIQVDNEIVSDFITIDDIKQLKEMIHTNEK